MTVIGSRTLAGCFFIYVNFVEYIGINISHRYLYLGIPITSKLRAALPIPILIF